jgi:hypothetical protein
MVAVGLFFLLILAYAALTIVAYSVLYGISPMPSLGKAQICMQQAIPQDVRGRIYDLGSGWGNLVVSLARSFPQCSVWGYEVSPIPRLFSKALIAISGIPRAHIENGDFFKIPLNDATVVVCYLYPKAMALLKEKFQRELAPGTWVVSNTFAVPGWKPYAVFQVDDLYLTKIYVYKIPLLCP